MFPPATVVGGCGLGRPVVYDEVAARDDGRREPNERYEAETAIGRHSQLDRQSGGKSAVGEDVARLAVVFYEEHGHAKPWEGVWLLEPSDDSRPVALDVGAEHLSL